MTFYDSEILGCFEFEVEMFGDDRGHFLVPFNKNLFTNSKGYFGNFIQDNESYSKYGTIRGLHYQKKEFAQSKLVRCVSGVVKDVVVDIRPKSSTYLNIQSFYLDRPNKLVFIPKGCLHGFSVLSENAILQYKVDRPYNKESEGGVRFDDPTFKIDWEIPSGLETVSQKDLDLPFFS